MLQVFQKPDDLTGEQAVCAANIGLAGFLGNGLWLDLGPGHGLTGQVGDGINKDNPLVIDHLNHLRIGLAQVLIMALGVKPVWIRCRVNTADQASDVDGVGKCPDGDALAFPVLD